MASRALRDAIETEKARIGELNSLLRYKPVQASYECDAAGDLKASIRDASKAVTAAVKALDDVAEYAEAAGVDVTTLLGEINRQLVNANYKLTGIKA